MIVYLLVYHIVIYTVYLTLYIYSNTILYRSLDITDLYYKDDTLIHNLSTTFTTYFDHEKEKLKTYHIKNNNTATLYTFTDNKNSNILYTFWTSPVTKAIIKMYKNDFIYSGILKFINTCIQFSPSILISLIVGLAENSGSALSGSAAARFSTGIVKNSIISLISTKLKISYIQTLGYIYTILLLLSLCSKTFLENQYFDSVINIR